MSLSRSLARSLQPRPRLAIFIAALVVAATANVEGARVGRRHGRRRGLRKSSGCSPGDRESLLGQLNAGTGPVDAHQRLIIGDCLTLEDAGTTQKKKKKSNGAKTQKKKKSNGAKRRNKRKHAERKGSLLHRCETRCMYRPAPWFDGEGSLYGQAHAPVLKCSGSGWDAQFQEANVVPTSSKAYSADCMCPEKRTGPRCDVDCGEVLRSLSDTAAYQPPAPHDTQVSADQGSATMMARHRRSSVWMQDFAPIMEKNIGQHDVKCIAEDAHKLYSRHGVNPPSGHLEMAYTGVLNVASNPIGSVGGKSLASQRANGQRPRGRFGTDLGVTRPTPSISSCHPGLTFNTTVLSCTAAKWLAWALSGDKRGLVQSLVASRTAMGDMGCDALAHVLMRPHNRLQELILRENALGSTCARYSSASLADGVCGGCVCRVCVCAWRGGD